MELDPEKLSMPDRYGLLISVIQPRPIAWVSTKGKDGSLNLAPFSFFMGITARDIQRVANTYFTRNNRLVITIMPRGQTQ